RAPPSGLRRPGRRASGRAARPRGRPGSPPRGPPAQPRRPPPPAPCLRAADDQGFTIDEAEVVYWGLCPACTTARSA
ncbi:hypothetical protein ACFWX0_35710, partial [Nonomuraea sp. NPDC059022]